MKKDWFHQILAYLYDEKRPHHELISITEFLINDLNIDAGNIDDTLKVNEVLQELQSMKYIKFTPNRTGNNRFEGQPFAVKHPNADISEASLLKYFDILAKIEYNGIQYIENKRTEAKQQSLFERQTNSILETNQSIKKTNDFTRRVSRYTLWVSIVSVLFIIVSAYEATTVPTSEQYQKTLQLEQETLQLQRQILQVHNDYLSFLRSTHKKIDTVYLRK